MAAEGDEAKESYYEFSLPDDEYWGMKFAKRLASDGSSSPPLLPDQHSSPSMEWGRQLRRHSTVDDTDGEQTLTSRVWSAIEYSKNLVPRQRPPGARR